MTRTILAIATVFIGSATLMSSAANACISCNYVPEVIKAGEKQAYVKRPQRQPAQVVHAARKPTQVKQRVATTAPVVKNAAPKAGPLEVKSEQTAATSPEVGQAATSTTTSAPVQVADAGTAVAAQTAANASVTCVKFFPTIGKTLEVPCE